jgi:hypothetical protein
MRKADWIIPSAPETPESRMWRQGRGKKYSMTQDRDEINREKMEIKQPALGNGNKDQECNNTHQDDITTQHSSVNLPSSPNIIPIVSFPVATLSAPPLPGPANRETSKNITRAAKARKKHKTNE